MGTKVERELRKCPCCETEYLCRPNDAKKYCSRKCYDIAQKNKPNRICEHCGKPFMAYPYRIKNGEGKFCSRECSTQSAKKSETVRCAWCDKPFSRWPSQGLKEKGKYCSKECYTMSQKIPVESTCKNCGATFTRSPSGIGKSGLTFCCIACRQEYAKGDQAPNWRGGKITRECKNCGKSFEIFPSYGIGYYCSNHCAAIHNARRGSQNPMWRGGHKYYRGKNWFSQRKLVHERDGDICQYCHRKRRKHERRFHVHHIIPFRMFNGDYVKANDLSNLILLCSKCHKKGESGKLAVPKRLL